jgi:hypothetical protein
MDNTTVERLAPRTATRARANRMGGNAQTTSRERITVVSTVFPKNPAHKPAKPPRKAEMATDPIPTIKAILVP